MSERHRRLFFVAMFALVFYLVGASFVESFVTYPTWQFVGRNEFPAYYHELASRIVRIMVLGRFTDRRVIEVVAPHGLCDYVTEARLI